MRIYTKQYSKDALLDGYKEILQDLGIRPSESCKVQVVVKKGEESPYRFSLLMRQVIDQEQELAEIYAIGGVYFAINNSNNVAFCKSGVRHPAAKIPPDCLYFERNLQQFPHSAIC
jgi:hypothetical protein